MSIGESIDLSEFYNEIKNMIKKYIPDEIYYLNETGLIYKLIISKTTCTTNIEGCKNFKDRVSILLCSISDGLIS